MFLHEEHQQSQQQQQQQNNIYEPTVYPVIASSVEKLASKVRYMLCVKRLLCVDLPSAATLLN